MSEYTPESPVLRGLEQIAGYLRITRNRAFHLVHSGGLRAARLGERGEGAWVTLKKYAEEDFGRWIIDQRK